MKPRKSTPKLVQAKPYKPSTKKPHVKRPSEAEIADDE